MMRWETSPAPFEVPPDSTSMSLASQRLAHRGFELRFIVGNGAEKRRLAAILR